MVVAQFVQVIGIIICNNSAPAFSISNWTGSIQWKIFNNKRWDWKEASSVAVIRKFLHLPTTENMKIHEHC